MTILIDTSAFYAVIDRDDKFSPLAIPEWERLIKAGVKLVTTNYIVLETAALAQARIGLKAVEVFHEDMLPVIHVQEVSFKTHLAVVKDMLAANSRELSMVDCVSFAVMQSLGIREAFTFDRHFSKQGFTVIPKY